jgi:outer membrane lipoprotein SlyB
MENGMDEDVRTPAASDDRETHATTGGAAAAGAVVAGAIGLTGGPIAAAIGAVGGAIVGAAAERMMHGEDDHLPPTPRSGDDTRAE